MMFVRKAKYDALEAQHEETLRELAEVRGKLGRIMAPLKAANEKRRRSSVLARLAENNVPSIGASAATTGVA